STVHSPQSTNHLWYMKVSFEHISKSFGGTEVLHDVGFSVEGGQILALLGENGAGKSTLMNIFGGLFPPDEGNIVIDGKIVRFRSPSEAISSGIAFIHQELNPVNDLRVYENMFLGREERNGLGFLKRKEMQGRAHEMLASLGIDIDEQCFMRDLGASHKQIVEICRALLCEAKLLIMDEPTTSLAEHEIDFLFKLVRRLSSQGVGVIFISHKLNEVKALCTDYVVLRNGNKVAEGTMSEVDTVTLAELIVGRKLELKENAGGECQGKTLLQVRNLTHGRDFQDVSFDVKEGEILGVTGLLGAGHSELFRCIFGDITDYSGQILLDGREYHAMNSGEAMKRGIAYVPSNRKENAIIPDLSVRDNATLATLGRYARLGLLQKNAQHRDFAQKVDELHIKYSNEDDTIGTLSGGNQQKVILARWLGTSPRLLILDNPTQGVDIGAKQEIYDIIESVAQSGVAVIVLSGEGREISRVCQRALVMFHGRIAGELTGASINEQEIMKLATGAKS
ncbi:MAG: sugar ABC transporter ATP-binding protein, partial [Victivallales bacterium]|nr:sugar ABC transporter ATP-binding protein [Victivallales bacterium]